MTNETVPKRPGWAETAFAAGTIVVLAAIGAGASIRNNSEQKLTEGITLENNLERAVRDGLVPDKDGFFTISDGKQDEQFKTRKEVIGDTPERDTFSEVFIADGGDPAKVNKATDIATAELSDSGSLAGAQPGDAAYIPDYLYLPEQPNQ